MTTGTKEMKHTSERLRSRININLRTQLAAILLSLYSCHVLFQEFGVMKWVKETTDREVKTRNQGEEEAPQSISSPIPRPLEISRRVIEEDKVPIFHPFNDLILVDQALNNRDNTKNNALVSDDANMNATRTAQSIKEPLFYSSHRCARHGTASFLPDYVGNTCIFRNVYFQPHPKKPTFHYFVSPQASHLQPDEEALRNEITLAAGYFYYADKNYPDGALKFTFKIHFNEDVPKNAPTVGIRDNPKKTPLFLLYKMSYSFNVGHQIWDDVLSLFTMLDFFGYAFERKSYQPVPMQLDMVSDPFYRCNPPKFRWKECGKMIGRVMPSLAGIDMIHETTKDAFRAGNAFRTGSAVLPDPSTTMVRLPLVIAGPGNMAEYGCRGECASHWTGRIYRFRQWVLENIFGTLGAKEMQVAPASQITISLPVGNTHAKIEQFSEIIPALQERFGQDNVVTVDFATLSWEEQAKVAIASKVFLTNQGGGIPISTTWIISVLVSHY